MAAIVAILAFQSIVTVLAIFDLQVSRIFRNKFRVNWPFSSGEERKIDFQDGGHGGRLGFLIRIIVTIFVSTSHPDAPTKF